METFGTTQFQVIFKTHRNFWDLLVDPFPQFFNGLFGGNLEEKVAIARDKDLGQKEMAHEDRVDHQGHEPKGVNE